MTRHSFVWFMVWVALIHADRSRLMIVAGITLAIVAAGAGVAETRPLSAAAAERLASMVADPEEHQTCRSSSGVEVCVFTGYEEYLDRVIANVIPVAAVAPRSARTAIFRQVFDGDLAALGPEVAAALDGRSVPAAGFLPLGYLNPADAMTVARLTLALDAVGLPVRSPPSGMPTVIAGEARGVVVLWLAARGLEPDAARELASHHFDPDDHSGDVTATALDLGMAWPDPCTGDRSPPVAWSAQDLEAARALLEVPADDVQRLLLDDWARFTAPATSTDELLAAAGLDPVGPPDRVVAAPIVCDW